MKPASKTRKRIPTLVSIIIILAVVVIVALIWFAKYGRQTPVRITKEAVAELQAFIDKGGRPMMPVHVLKELGIKLPPGYEQGAAVPARPAQRKAAGP